MTSPTVGPQGLLQTVEGSWPSINICAKWVSHAYVTCTSILIPLHLNLDPCVVRIVRMCGLVRMILKKKKWEREMLILC